MSEIHKIGDVFGRWTIIERLKRKKNRNTRVLCRCICGTEKEVELGNLVKGASTSCGCFGKEFRSSAKKKKPFEYLYNSLLNRAKTAGRECSISYEDFVVFTQTRECFYCGIEIPWEEHSSVKRKRSMAYYLDRVDSSIGYHKENCVVACTRCNQSKSNTFSHEEWIWVGKAIRDFREFQDAHEGI